MSLYTIETHGELEPGLSQEWLLTNGIGAYSSSSIVGCNRRRYHGLLVAATLPPVGRIVALSRIGEILKVDGSDVIHELGVNQFANNFHPRGDRYLKQFQTGDIAQWDYDMEGVKITKQVQLLWKRNVVGVRYIVDPAKHSRVQMQIVPFAALRDFHSLRHSGDASMNVKCDPHHVSVSENNQVLHLHCDDCEFIEARDWWRGHFYAIEAERGQDCFEDLFTPGRFTIEITKPTTFTLWASTENVESFDWDNELRTRQAAAGPRPARSPTIEKLHHAAADFIVDRKCPDGSMGTTVMAGYPWFADWGRDTMISLPGLFLHTRRVAEAGNVLKVFADYVSEGMIPNRFDDYTNEPSYNTVDASLWFIHACFEFLKAGGDSQLFEQKLLPACRAIVEGYSKGTRFHIRMDEDGLITQGDASTQLTWMDAKCNDVTFTPRQGKAVEINALWYNALKLIKNETLAAKVKESFIKAFWISPFRGLADCVNGGVRDAKIRPNQIFAASLPHSPLNEEQQQAVVEVVRRELLTPFGLRTLSPSDPQFHGKYTGNQFQRDGAYHNGTIWPWLIGAFLEAYLKTHQRSEAAIAQVKSWLTPLLDAMEHQGCIGQIAEIHEADPPHRPVGCFAQAWSIAEVLRIADELKM
jgi:predicted glycogen debranching enzyme